MNTFTKTEMFTEDALFILDNSDLLIKSDCVILDNVLYERLSQSEYRFFFNTDDYDYLVNEQVIARLDTMFE
jgi:hypothetical protein